MGKHLKLVKHSPILPEVPYEEQLDPVAKKMAMRKIIDQLKNSESPILIKFTQKLRKELIEQIPHLKMGHDRRSYFIHQMAYARELDEISHLVEHINSEQLTRPLSEQNDLIFITESLQGIHWMKHAL